MNTLMRINRPGPELCDFKITFRQKARRRLERELGKFGRRAISNCALFRHPVFLIAGPPPDAPKVSAARLYLLLQTFFFLLFCIGLCSASAPRLIKHPLARSTR